MSDTRDKKFYSQFGIDLDDEFSRHQWLNQYRQEFEHESAMEAIANGSTSKQFRGESIERVLSYFVRELMMKMDEQNNRTSKIEDRLFILQQPDSEDIREFQELREAYERYKAAEEKIRTFKALKYGNTYP